MRLKNYFPKFLRKSKPDLLSSSDLLFSRRLTELLDCPVTDVSIYKEAFSIKSAAKSSQKNYERLEFLGDSILGSVIACHLFSIYPDGNEGFLTQMKSKIVNRKNLNKIGDELTLTGFLINHSPSTPLSENISGNLFEALIGALYLDQGYDCCRQVILEKLLTLERIQYLEKKIVSYKSILLEWSQKKKCSIKYETCEETQNKSTVFRTIVWLHDNNIANATETSKKKSEEKAAQRAFYYLNKKENIVGKPDHI